MKGGGSGFGGGQRPLPSELTDEERAAGRHVLKAALEVRERSCDLLRGELKRQELAAAALAEELEGLGDAGWERLGPNVRLLRSELTRRDLRSGRDLWPVKLCVDGPVRAGGDM